MQPAPSVQDEPLKNIAVHVREMAQRAPYQRAVVTPSGRDKAGRVAYAHETFLQLERRSNRIASGLAKAGVTPGTRVVLMVPPSLDFFALVFGLFKSGATIVMIDPGIGRAALLSCLKEVGSQAFVGVPKAHIARLLFPASFREVKTLVTVGRKLFWGGHTLEELEASGDDDFDIPTPKATDLAAILFTSGSTGVPKGAEYTHGVFGAQVAMLRSMYGMEPGEVDLCTFPLFALFAPALGLTAVVPDMDASRPADADPKRLLEAIFDQGATQLFGSPALLDVLSRHCEAQGIRLPSLRRVVSAGAPANLEILGRMAKALPEGVQIFTPYGATESLPVANIGSDFLLNTSAEKTFAGAGVCVGHPVDGMTIRVIAITDGPIADWDDAQELGVGELGEITSKGPVVTKGYFRRPESTALAKINEGGETVHRMGDIGYFDEDGRLWMCGRKSHRVQAASGTLFTIPCEAPFNTHPGVRKSALVGLGAAPEELPALVIECAPGVSPSEGLINELKAIAARYPHTAAIDTFLFYKGGLPVDIRHNAKINRGILKTWANTQQGLEVRS